MKCNHSRLIHGKHLTSRIVLVALSLLFLAVPQSRSASVEDQKKYQQVLEMYRSYTKKFPEVKDIPAKDAILQLNNKNTVFVDVRRADEQEISMIPRAITKQEFLDNLENYRDKNIIAYCTISYRSGKFAKAMAKKGISITNLEAGLLSWTHEDGPLHHDNREVNKLHVYGKKWNLVPKKIEAVY